MNIGTLHLNSPALLAPMAGVNCAAFRLLCKGFGAGLVSTPMIVINQLVQAPEKIIARTCFLKEEKPISVQLVGSDSALAKQAMEIIEPYADIIDINLGCPDKDILALKAGSFFIKHPEQIKKIVSPIVSSTNKPVTAKIRIGWDEKTINTKKTVKLLEDLGVSAIAIHGRTAKQKYAGKADWNEIAKAKGTANVPIIGNGDIFLPGHAKAMMEQTGCDGVMIGRGVIGNPYLFKQIEALLRSGKNIPAPTVTEQKNIFHSFLENYKKYENLRSMTELKQQAMWFTTSMNGAKSMRLNLMKAQSVEEILSIYQK